MGENLMDGPPFARLLREPPKREEIVLGKGATAHDLLKIIYQSSELPLSVRMRAAIAALPFETPKLAVSYQASESDFAELLDQRIKRHEAKLIEHQQPIASDRSLSRIPDRRFRRI
jgi:polysaccharide pyruvyl transferase WcaK-like protein